VAVSRQEVAAAFLASLSTRRLEWRSALGSYTVARLFPDHPHGGPASAGHCTTCGSSSGTHDLSVLNFERFKWGGVRHLDPVYAAFDLELFARAAKPVPQAEDFAILSRIVASARGMPPEARLDDLERGLGKHLVSSKQERRVLMEILGHCGILPNPDHPGFLNEFTPFAARETASSHGDWAYPVEHWRGRHGVNEAAVDFWFRDCEGVRS
jgi:hypothetical protein